MNKLVKGKTNILNDDRGGTDFLEKIIMIAFVAFVVLLGVKYLGKKVKGKFMEQGNSVQSSISGGVPTQ